MAQRHPLSFHKLSDGELGALSELPNFEGWKALCKLLRQAGANLRNDLYDHELDKDPVMHLRMLGRSQALEQVLESPVLASDRLQKRREDEKNGTRKPRGSLRKQ